MPRRFYQDESDLYDDDDEAGFGPILRHTWWLAIAVWAFSFYFVPTWYFAVVGAILIVAAVDSALKKREDRRRSN